MCAIYHVVDFEPVIILYFPDLTCGGVYRVRVCTLGVQSMHLTQKGVRIAK